VHEESHEHFSDPPTSPASCTASRRVRGGHVALNIGVEFPLSDQSYNTRYHLNLLWDFADGSFFKGW
jgi:hypothetical protein